MIEIEDVDREGLVRLFLEESGEGLSAMEQALVALEHDPHDTDAVQSLFRAAHTLKGNAQSLGFTDLAALTHGVEDVLDRLRSGAIEAERAVVDLLLESVDALRAMLGEIR